MPNTETSLMSKFCIFKTTILSIQCKHSPSAEGVLAGKLPLKQAAASLVSKAKTGSTMASFIS